MIQELIYSGINTGLHTDDKKKNIYILYNTGYLLKDEELTEHYTCGTENPIGN
ncbi:MAG: hypothetical protein ACM3X1_04760 [Ignavibacteriales bacterium]